MGWLHSNQWFRLLLYYHSVNHNTRLLPHDQDGCLSSSHHTHITVSCKEEGTKKHVPLPLRHFENYIWYFWCHSTGNDLITYPSNCKRKLRNVVIILGSNVPAVIFLPKEEKENNTRDNSSICLVFLGSEVYWGYVYNCFYNKTPLSYWVPLMQYCCMGWKEQMTKRNMVQVSWEWAAAMAHGWNGVSMSLMLITYV